MLDDSISPEVKNLIDRHLSSVGHLETLTFLFEHRDRSWTPAQIGEELRTNVRYAESQLEDLANSGLLDRLESKNGVSYRYRYENSNTDKAVEKLIRLYHSRRVSIIEAIYDQDRTLETVKSFADAFIIKKE